MMSRVYICIALICVCLSYALCAPSYEFEADDQNPNTLLDLNENEDPSNYDKRVERYAFGLGRRAYTYMNGGNDVKRLPIYNFGLGKRTPNNLLKRTPDVGRQLDMNNDDFSLPVRTEMQQKCTSITNIC